MNCVPVLFLIFVFLKCTEQVTIETLLSKNQPVEDVNVTIHEERGLRRVIPGARRFAARLYSVISKEEGNVIVSPLSLQLVLALVLVGAKGSTHDELSKLLSLQDTTKPVDVSNAFFEVMSRLGHRGLIKSVQNKRIKLANRMFLDKSFRIKEDFQWIATDYFFSPAQSIDFRNKPDESRQHINTWVERQTNDKIRDLLEDGSITAATRLVLVNAIHFKANWKTKFSVSDTENRQFFLSSSEKVSIPMMRVKSKFDLLHDSDLGAKFLRLDYKGGKFEMIVILPDDLDGLSDLESKLTNVDIFDRLEESRLRNVTVILPKFKVKMTHELKPVLMSMGVSTMFSESADLGEITDEPVSISSVVQKTFIEVSENGTEAAAATTETLTGMSGADEDSVRFEANHPFVFIISLKERQVPIFYGRYAGPDK